MKKPTYLFTTIAGTFTILAAFAFVAYNALPAGPGYTADGVIRKPASLGAVNGDVAKPNAEILFKAGESSSNLQAGNNKDQNGRSGGSNDDFNKGSGVDGDLEGGIAGDEPGNDDSPGNDGDNGSDSGVGGDFPKGCSQELVIDNGDEGHTTQGEWKTLSYTGYKTDELMEVYDTEPPAASSTWCFMPTKRTEHKVYVTWENTVKDNVVTQNAKYEVRVNGKTKLVNIIDQNSAPEGEIFDEVPWQELGILSLSEGDKVTVVLDNLDKEAFVMLADAVRFEKTGSSGNNEEVGSLHVTKDYRTPLPPRQLIAGRETESVLQLKLEAEYEDVMVEQINITTANINPSISELNLFIDETATPVVATRSHCGDDSSPTAPGYMFCADYSFVVPNGEAVVVDVHPVLYSETNGGVSGEEIRLRLNTSDGFAAIEAIGVESSDYLTINDANGVIDGEIFIAPFGADASSKNSDITSSNNYVVYNGLQLITNALADDGGAIPTGPTNFGAWELEAYDTVNNGTITIDNLMLNVSGGLNTFTTGSFKIYINGNSNGASQHTCVESATTGDITVDCSDIMLNGAPLDINNGDTITLHLEADIAPAVDTHLQASLQNFNGPADLYDSDTHVLWTDEANGNRSEFLWFDYPEQVVKSARYGNAPECNDGIDNDGDGLIDHPEDPGCDNAEDNDESGNIINDETQCNNGADDDGDGKTDYPEDPGCYGYEDDDEIEYTGSVTGGGGGTEINGVAGRYVFYNNTSYDGDNDSLSADDNAIASDKSPVLPGATASMNNYVSNIGGLQGIMIDVYDLAGTPTTNDFVFKVGNDNKPGSWRLAKPPQSVSVRSGEGVDGSDRVSITWPAGTFNTEWLQVTMLANNVTGLTQDDVHYWGSLIGDVNGPYAGRVRVNLIDVGTIRSNETSDATIDNLYDIDRDGKVDEVDAEISRQHQTSFASMHMLNLAE